MADTLVEPRTDVSELGGQFLTFFLGSEEYGLEILKVQEIIGTMEITTVPRTPEYIRGVINLRGKVIPVLELRLKFGMPSTERTEETCIIVVRSEQIEMGVEVDRVSEVVDIASEVIEPVPPFGSSVESDYLLGIGKSDDGVRLLLNIDNVITAEDNAELQAAAQQS